MGSLRRRLGLLEREAGQHHEVLVLPGGAKLHYSPEEAAAAFAAAVKGAIGRRRGRSSQTSPVGSRCKFQRCNVASKRLCGA